VGQPGGVDDVGVGTQLLGDAATDLRDLQRVRQPGARHAADLGPLPRPDDLGLPGEPAQRRGVQDAGPVAGERGAPAVPGGLGRFGFPTVAVMRGVTARAVQPNPVVSVSTGAFVIV
jgi:hypothetical protein